MSSTTDATHTSGGAGALPSPGPGSPVVSPSYTPGKETETFRVYQRGGDWNENVFNHYKAMRTNQTMEFVDRMHAKWHTFDHAEMTVWEAFQALKGYVDSSDPDTTLPNIFHGFQTAERARAAGRPEWFQLVCLIHDMGKLMFLWGKAEDGQLGKAEGPQFALGGDTWVMGCKIPDCAVYPELNALNPDMANPAYNTENGIYTPGCGMMSLKYAYGHDEYLYQMLVHNRIAFPVEGLAMVRLHSCYPWHRGGAYTHLMAPGDESMLAAVRDFNQFDLYSKSDDKPDIEALWTTHYAALVERYMPGKLRW